MELHRKRIQELDVDELAVVLYIRLVFHVLLGVVAMIMGFLASQALLPEAWNEFAARVVMGVVGALYFGWAVRTLWVIRQELRTRERHALTHTPTFYSWARATHVFAFASLTRPLLSTWTDGKALLDWVTGMGWVMSCLMAGFYLLYFLLLFLVWQRPPFVIVRAFILALAAAMVPPPDLAIRGEPPIQEPTPAARLESAS
ncbi:MAG TPA: hypothetical protein DDZ88_06535 [Verrucomicrobiales bacterium]|nr:hypothetical protein [Verrucomicrobiales bacterium]